MKCKKNSKTHKSSQAIKQAQAIKEDKVRPPELVTEESYPSALFNSKPTWAHSTLQTLKTNNLPNPKFPLKKDTNLNSKPKSTS